jgi:predicted nucleotidyltransferase
MSHAADLPDAMGHVQDERLRETLKRVKQALTEAVGPAFRLILFGSRARGDADPDADVDLMVILPDEAYTFANRQAVYDIAAEVSLEHDFLVVPMIVSEHTARGQAGFMVFGAVEREGRRV